MSERVGIVVVSHSAALADAVVDLATQMVVDDPPPIAVAAGVDGGLGTDAMAVMAAIESVASPRGVVVLMDLGSAVMSAETALEFIGDDVAVRLTAAPLVEGVVAAVVQASLGSDLDVVVAEAEAGLAAKQGHLGDSGQPGDTAAPGAGDRAATDPAPDAVDDADTVTSEATIVNRDGLHARPAVQLVQAVGRWDATITIANLTTGAGPADGASLSAIAALDARNGHQVRITATGPDARAAADDLAAVVASGFGEPSGPSGDDPSAVPDADDDVGQPVAAGSDDTVRALAPGLAHGPVRRLAPVAAADAADAPDAADDAPRDADSTIVGLRHAATVLAQGLTAMAAASPHPDVAAILGATAAIAQDPALLDGAARRIRDGVAAPDAVHAAADDIATALADAGGLVAERRRDVVDVADRLAAALGTGGPTDDQGHPVIRPVLADGQPVTSTTPDTDFVLVAHDLAPVDAAGLADSRCVGIVTGVGSPTSHTAIVARALGLPAVAAGDVAADLVDDTLVEVDGTEGRLVVHARR